MVACHDGRSICHFCFFQDEWDSEHERYDGVETSRKHKKCIQHKVHESASKGSVGHFRMHPEAVPPDYSFLSILKKKRSGGKWLLKANMITFIMLFSLTLLTLLYTTLLLWGFFLSLLFSCSC